MGRTLVVLLAFLAGGCGDDEGGTTPDAPPAVDARPDSAIGCAAPTGPGTEHSTAIAVDETWTEEDSPHIVTFDIAVTDATLTIEPCAVVRVKTGYGIVMNGTTGTGRLVAHGETV